MQDKSSVAYFPQEKITARFWLNNPKIFDEVLEKLKDFSPSILPYNGSIAPYKYYKGRIVFVFKGSELEKFHKALAIVHTYSALTEMLVNDDWLQIKAPIKIIQTSVA